MLDSRDAPSKRREAQCPNVSVSPHCYPPPIRINMVSESASSFAVTSREVRKQMQTLSAFTDCDEDEYRLYRKPLATTITEQK